MEKTNDGTQVITSTGRQMHGYALMKSRVSKSVNATFAWIVMMESWNTKKGLCKFVMRSYLVYQDIGTAGVLTSPPVKDPPSTGKNCDVEQLMEGTSISKALMLTKVQYCA